MIEDGQEDSFSMSDVGVTLGEITYSWGAAPYFLEDWAEALRQASYRFQGPSSDKLFRLSSIVRKTAEQVRENWK